MTPSQPDLRSTHVQGRLRVVIQAGCLALVVMLLVPFVAGVPVRLRHLLTLASAAEPPVFVGSPPALEAVFTSRLGPAEAEALPAIGLSLRFYAAYLLTFEVGLALVCAVVGLFIFWRRSEGWLTLWVSVLLVLLGTNSVSPEVPMLATLWPGWGSLYTGAGMLGMVSNLHILFLSPDGRFVPRWTRPLAAGFTGGMLALSVYAVTAAWNWGLLAGMALLFVAIPFWFGLICLGIFSQVYRYRHVSGPVQRQQTKWVVVGLAAVTLGFLVNASFLFAAGQATGLPRVLVNLARAPLVYLCLLVLPICLAFSILRYRLWDIDLLIRRTLVYAALTGLLALAYFGSILVLQGFVRLLTGQSQSPVVTVVSTLAIAALFVPLRRRVQAFIDRRFYRRKYDAARTLAAFSNTVRDEVELQRLTEHLTRVVEETLQPESVSLWLRAARDEGRTK